MKCRYGASKPNASLLVVLDATNVVTVMVDAKSVSFLHDARVAEEQKN
jgi:hypothetical protein